MRSTHVKKNQCLTTLSILNVSGFYFTSLSKVGRTVRYNNVNFTPRSVNISSL